jgi:hypothetical protein
MELKFGRKLCLTILLLKLTAKDLLKKTQNILLEDQKVYPFEKYVIHEYSIHIFLIKGLNLYKIYNII